MDKECSKHIDMMWLHMSIAEMLQEIMPDFVCDMKLLSQYDHSIKLLVNHMANLRVNGIGSEIEGVVKCLANCLSHRRDAL